MGIKVWWQRIFNPPEPITIYTVDTQTPHQRRDDHPFEQYKVRSLIGRGVTMVGDITSEVGMVIDGHQKGGITMTGDGTALIIRAGGCVEGPVSSPIVVISGTVIGDVQGHFVRLYPGAKVEGAVAAKRLIVDDGAEINSTRIGSGAWVAPALEHLPTVTPNTAPHLPASAPVDDVTDVPSEQPHVQSHVLAHAEVNAGSAAHPCGSPVAPAQDWTMSVHGDSQSGAEVIQIARTSKTPVRSPPARRTKKPPRSPAAARASPSQLGWSATPSPVVSVLHVEVASALDACRGPPHHRIDGEALNRQREVHAA